MSWWLIIIAAWLILVAALYGHHQYQLVRAPDGQHVYLVKRGPQARARARALYELERETHRFLHGIGEHELAKRWRLRGERPGQAYTQQKTDMYICGQYQDPDPQRRAQVERYVLLHELSHVKNRGWGHTRRFWQHFQRLKAKAQATGYYRPPTTPVNYCGAKIIRW
jgi:hypothetical protein